MEEQNAYDGRRHSYLELDEVWVWEARSPQEMLTAQKKRVLFTLGRKRKLEFKKPVKYFTIKGGCTRTVFLIGKYAIKIPRLNYGMMNFLRGMLGNMQEALFSTMISENRICPVLFSGWGGIILIMPRAQAISEFDFKRLDITDFWGKPTRLTNGYYGDCKIPVEHKIDSFGWYGQGKDRRIVAIDYGS